MINLPCSADEDHRLAMLATLERFESGRDVVLDELAALARDVSGADIALVSLVHSQEVRFAGSAGFDQPSICRWDSFCNHAIFRPSETLWVEDALADARFFANPFVAGPPHLRFYVGAPIRVNDCVVGTLCVLGPQPLPHDPDLERRLVTLARIAEGVLAERHRTNAMRRALEASGDALIDCDAHGRILTWSDGAETLFGYSRGEAIGRNIDLIVPPEFRDAHRAGMERWRVGGAARLGRRLELPAIRRSGEPLDIELWMSVSQTDAAPQIHANIRDISERKTQARELAVAKAHAEDANRAKTAFLANMSHELRTPLNGVIAAVDMLGHTPLTDHQTELADIVRSSSHQLERLIADVLDLARIESGELNLKPEPVDLRDLIDGVVALCGLKAAEKGVVLSVDIAADADQRVLADPVRLKQVLTNLLSNAVKFTDEGLISLGLSRTEAGRYRFEVRDTGVGFRLEQRDLIFGRFQQADDTVTRRFGGTGLGLAISRDLVAAMDGEMDCAATPGVGAVFWFEIPLAAAPHAAPAASRDAADLGSARVLIVDDNPTNRRVAELILHSAGVSTASAENGEIALEYLFSQPFDAVLMDMMMPVMDGVTAVRALRAREADLGLTPTPVAMLTANSLPEHVEACLAAGADRHLAKPITPAALLTAVAAMCDLSAAQPAATGMEHAVMEGGRAAG